MSELLDRTIAAAEAVKNLGRRRGRGRCGINYAAANSAFKKQMEATRPPKPKYRNAELWKKIRKNEDSYFLYPILVK